jgi:hypothetical protein
MIYKTCLNLVLSQNTQMTGWFIWSFQ